MSVIRCSHCGTTNRTGSNFCNRCGTDLRDQEGHTTEQPAERAGAFLPAGDDAAALHPATSADESDAADDGRARDGAEQQSERPARPWLSSPSAEDTFDEPEDAADDDAIYRDQPGEQPRRLVSGIQGLLDPIRISSNLGAEELAEQGRLSVPLLTVPAAQLRQIRGLVAEDPILLEHRPPPVRTTQVRLRLPWLIALLTLAVGLPILLFFGAPVGQARQWPGVVEAHAAIDALPPASTVWIFWAYDPATAGEMDLVALPLATHLIERQAQATVVTLLPTGLATARRLWQRAADPLVITEGVGVLNGRTSFVEAAYLPGGAAALALLAATPQQALLGHTERAANWLALTTDQRPALTIVLAAHPEEVQQWLELVQTERQLPVLAFTGAGADPVLRPYLATGQLQGLVSGFDGAAAYQQLRNRGFVASPSVRDTTQLIAQNWGHVALLLILLLGNLRALWLGDNRG